eukprot:CAMPEP_0178970664 /NCGR_PEP_ID=MMETSP0789-20121207/19720_1 /TAXON_ID=3005 /ORGANISM="Rhizosolenia setigera, Strain CCMP 1694" /LENGTH=397 /DNA_ID=CAMNT_0020657299 /DNA_START=1 /DNA_END=1191 /DNA_ORIENTATION=+
MMMKQQFFSQIYHLRQGQKKRTLGYYSIFITTSILSSIHSSSTALTLNVGEDAPKARSSVINPSSGRSIKIPTDDSTDIKRTKWYDLMFRSGGSICFGGKLCPIKYGEKEGYYNIDDNELEGEEEDDDWHLLEPTILHQPKGENSKFLQQMIFVNKPSNILTVPGRFEADCLSSRISGALNIPTVNTTPNENGSGKSSYKKKRRNKKKVYNDGSEKEICLKPCHRLDRDTSGIVAFGLDKSSHSYVSVQFQDRTISKTYVALVSGIVESDSGTIDLPIGKRKVRVQKENGSDWEEYSVWATTDNNENDDIEKPREAITYFEVSQRFHELNYTRVLLYPKTGRGHQLRLHMKSIGHSILGDLLHGENDSIRYATPRLCLHAQELELDLQLQDEEDEIL